MTKKPQQYVMLRRDGVITRRLAGGSIRSWKQVEFLPRALEGLRLLARNDYGVLVIADRDYAGEGPLSLHEHARSTQRLLLEVALEQGRIDQVYYGPPAICENGHRRAPDRGLLGRALAEHGLCAAGTYLISDSVNDLAVAAAVGCPQILLRRDAFLRPRVPEDAGHEVVTSLCEAAERVVGRRNASLRRQAGPKLRLIPDLYPGDYLRAASLEAQLREWSRAEAILEQGLRVHQENRDLRQALEEVTQQTRAALLQSS